MIYLIGGSPRGGKTILARQITEKLNIFYFSTDYLKLMLMPYFSEKAREKKFPFYKIWKKKNLDNFFREFSGRQMLAIDKKEAKTIWPGIRHLILHLRDRKIDCLFEGVHLMPELISEFKKYRDIKILFLVKSDQEKIFSALFKNRGKRDWIIDNVKNKNTLRLAAKSLGEYGNFIKKDAKKFNLHCINTEEDFFNQIKKAENFFIKPR